MAVAVCYCDDCQEGGRRIEALPHAARVRDDDGGTTFMTFRDDRFQCVAGADRLVGLKLREDSPTQRFVTTCCNAAIYLKFGPGFWVSAYRTRFEADDLPPLQMRIQVKHRDAAAPLPTDVPAYPGMPARLFLRGLLARTAMLLGR
jgi:hypothetical protein